VYFEYICWKFAERLLDRVNMTVIDLPGLDVKLRGGVLVTAVRAEFIDGVLCRWSVMRNNAGRKHTDRLCAVICRRKHQQKLETYYLGQGISPAAAVYTGCV